jgi:hypothetical protein
MVFSCARREATGRDQRALQAAGITEFCWPADRENPSMFADKPIMRSPQPSANQTMGTVNAKRGGGSQSGAASVM